MRSNNATTQSRLRGDRAGFTLTELLVVLAIIGILAAIVIPNVTKYIAKSRVTKSVAEIRNADTALTGMLSDAGVSRFRDFFLDPVSLGGMSLLEAQGMYQEIFYSLLRQGRNVDLTSGNLTRLNPAIVNKLGQSYMDIGADAWGNQYRFWPGPIRDFPMPFRAYRVTPGPTKPDDVGYAPYVYDGAAKADLDARIPGNPPADNTVGMPAPRDKSVYIYSLGPNELVDSFLWAIAASGIYEADPAFLGGGDDINNWDTERGWESAPR